jgi:hypothetical protein
MQKLVYFCLMSMAFSMVADLTAIEKHKHDQSVQVQSSGDVEEVAESVDQSSSTNWTCVSCCSSEMEKTRVLYKPEFDAGIKDKDYAGYKAFNTEREAAFMKCGAITSQRALFTTHSQLFLAWGGIVAKLPPLAFCDKACKPPQAVHPARVVFAGMISQIVDENRKTDTSIVTDSGNLVKTMKPGSAKSLTNSVFKTSMGMFSNDVQGTCTTGCFKGSKDVSVGGGKGTFCASTSAGSLNVCQETGLVRGYVGTCTGMTLAPSKSSYATGEEATFSSGSGNCKARDAISKITCQSGNTWIAYLNHGIEITVKVGDKCLLEEFAQDWKLTIDEALDHSEHGPHAEDLLVDCYRHALKEGMSLVERSRRDASHLKYQLEDRHMERAQSLYEALEEIDQKHYAVPVGFNLEFN